MALLIIFKEWKGRDNYPVARFYSCMTAQGIKYFLDWDNCHLSTEVFIFRDGVVNFQSDVPKRYSDWIRKNYTVVFN